VIVHGGLVQVWAKSGISVSATRWPFLIECPKSFIFVVSIGTEPCERKDESNTMKAIHAEIDHRFRSLLRRRAARLQLKKSRDSTLVV
jgi:hypothetical protein